MMSLRIGLNGIDCIIKLTPKLIMQPPGNGFILRRNHSGIFRSPRVNDQSLHRTSLPSAKLAEFIPRNTDDFSGVQFGRSMLRATGWLNWVGDRSGRALRVVTSAPIWRKSLCFGGLRKLLWLLFGCVRSLFGCTGALFECEGRLFGCTGALFG